MKKAILILGVAIMCSTWTVAQGTFTVKTGKYNNAAYFGHRMGNLNPYIGLNYVGMSGSYEYQDSYFDANGIQVTDVYTDQYSVAFITPTIGLKYFLSKDDDLKMYTNLYVGKPMLVTGGSAAGVSKEYNIRMMTSGIGLGAEYFLSPKFSVGGEYGFNFFVFKADYTYNTSAYNSVSDSYEPVVEQDKVKLGFDYSAARIALNYYFGKKMTGDKK